MKCKVSYVTGFGALKGCACTPESTFGSTISNIARLNFNILSYPFTDTSVLTVCRTVFVQDSLTVESEAST